MKYVVKKPSSEKVTSTQVAKLAGVSQSAVSRVFTPGANVSKRMSEKVRAAADKLGYRPNALARSLITGKSQIIGLVVTYLENQFYPQAIERLSNELQKYGYHILIFMASNDNKNTQTVIDELLDYQVDGIITASVGLSNDLTARCEAAGIPIVLFNRQQDCDHISGVCSDNVSGGRKLAELLVNAGHKRIAHIAGWESASTQRDREAGFMYGLQMAGQTLYAREVGNFDFDEAKEATRRMFAGEDIPDAVFVANDHMAFAVMDVLRHELKLRIPEDVSVVGYDDVPLSAWSSYDLTTIRQPVDRMVEETVRTLLSHIDEPDSEARRISIDGPLVLRGSCRLP
ncbi:LacI family transcriptional regulator [Vibrio nigripulchritudo]|uniref:LacI family DNA-binding transcriptional regulator n=1 Tax=Vibrio nigripulchritudo TaxID=28173 RepID=UPI00190E3F47|nr:LacI family DNA-binding transcriptional regulator [Vibrio nigripulchritudo]BCL70777.1 LacI family transcriptional regulator [Vibrio nigripulchritudo]BDU32133.1 LacI family transcriptional regulator [Vibrio nigripulchritudo]